MYLEKLSNILLPITAHLGTKQTVPETPSEQAEAIVDIIESNEEQYAADMPRE